MKLYGFWRSLATYRVRVALALKGLAAEQISIDLLQGKQHSEEYKAINPQSVVPALAIDGDPRVPGGDAPGAGALAEGPAQPGARSRPRADRGERRASAGGSAHPRLPRAGNASGRAGSQQVARVLDAGGAQSARRAPRQGKGDRPVLPRRRAYPRRHLPCLPGLRREVLQRRHRRGADGYAHFRGMHENRRFRPLAAGEATRRPPKSDPLKRDTEQEPTMAFTRRR